MILLCYNHVYIYIEAFLDIIISCKAYGFPSPSFSESLEIIRHIYWLHNSLTDSVYPTNTKGIPCVSFVIHRSFQAIWINTLAPVIEG